MNSLCNLWFKPLRILGRFPVQNHCVSLRNSTQHAAVNPNQLLINIKAVSVYLQAGPEQDQVVLLPSVDSTFLFAACWFCFWFFCFGSRSR